MIIVFRNEPPDEDHTLRALEVEDLDVVDRLSETVKAEAWLQPQATLDAQRGWALVRPEVLALLQKLRQRGVPLGEYIKGRFYRGIVTGYNKAFVIDQETRDRLVAEDPNSADIIKPWLRGRDIERWRVDLPGLFITYIPWDLKIDRYPAVSEYLKEHQKRLACRPEVRDGRYPWYALSRYAARYAEEFGDPKIIYPHFNTETNFAFEDTGAFSNDKTYIIPKASLYLLGLLNSKVCGFLLRQMCPSVRGDYLELRTTYVEQIPIVGPATPQREAIEALVRKLLDAEGQGPHVEGWERELNALVYEVYGLNDAEIAIIEEAVA
jgi:hypothetical protein